MNPMDAGIHPNDVVLGRGGNGFKHAGNEKLRNLARFQVHRYMNSTKAQKTQISREIVSYIRNTDPPGRFLKRVNGEWKEVSDDLAREKASQVIRDAVVIALNMTKGKKSERHHHTMINEDHHASSNSKLSPLSNSLEKTKVLDDMDNDPDKCKGEQERITLDMDSEQQMILTKSSIFDPRHQERPSSPTYDSSCIPHLPTTDHSQATPPRQRRRPSSPSAQAYQEQCNIQEQSTHHHDHYNNPHPNFHTSTVSPGSSLMYDQYSGAYHATTPHSNTHHADGMFNHDNDFTGSRGYFSAPPKSYYNNSYNTNSHLQHSTTHYSNYGHQQNQQQYNHLGPTSPLPRENSADHQRYNTSYAHYHYDHPHSSPFMSYPDNTGWGAQRTMNAPQHWHDQQYYSAYYHTQFNQSYEKEAHNFPTTMDHHSSPYPTPATNNKRSLQEIDHRHKNNLVIPNITNKIENRYVSSSATDEIIKVEVKQENDDVRRNSTSILPRRRHSEPSVSPCKKNKVVKSSVSPLHFAFNEEDFYRGQGANKAKEGSIDIDISINVDTLLGPSPEASSSSNGIRRCNSSPSKLGRHAQSPSTSPQNMSGDYQEEDDHIGSTEHSNNTNRKDLLDFLNKTIF
mmetsp:Transcript_9459/g.11010  ORF Transcript_9459/g.11010 Transcript_9459/m.11010 type:complete len:624 (+) Transcript_9459:111-1982(+)